MTRRRFIASAFVVVGAIGVAHPSITIDRLTGINGNDSQEEPAGTEDVTTTLVVADADSDERLFEIPVAEGDEVTLAYTHSVEKTPVQDIYVVDGAVLRGERMVFHSFGAGLPTQDVERTEEGYVVEGEGTYRNLFVAPSEIAGHELVVGDERYDLVAAADGTVVLFVADPEPKHDTVTADE